MAARILKWFLREGTIRIGLCLLLLASLYLLTAATENSARFGRLYILLLLFNTVGLVALLGLIGHNLWRLIVAFRAGQAGSRLTARLLLLFMVLAVIPGTVVYAFSMQFLRSGIDSWFDVRVEAALNNALELSQASLDLRMRDVLKRLESARRQLINVPDGVLPLALGDLRERMDASELTLLGINERIIASSSQDPAAILPYRPEDEVLLQLRQGRPYVALDPINSSDLQVYAAIPVPDPTSPQENRILQALFPISPRLDALASDVQRAFSDYRELTYLRDPLKDSFILTLSLVLLLSLLFALWSAFFLAKRLVAPISGLAEGTRALAEGDYGTQLPTAGKDELGFLVQSFNDMSRRVALARNAARRVQAQAEAQRAYLETVLGRLSSGVLAIDQDGILRTRNQAADHILAVRLVNGIGKPLTAIAHVHANIAPFADLVAERMASGAAEWREELSLNTGEGRRVLICSGAALSADVAPGGHVIVFDDVTTLIQAQRDAAWGEVARRLAHEIRNPLTPIRLSAERIRHKYLVQAGAPNAEMLDRATRTIIAQVDNMQAMVKAFSEYMRPPRLEIRPLNLNAFIQEAVELYRGNPDQPEFELLLAKNLPSLCADGGRLRQLLNNLIRNALEANPGDRRCRLTIVTRLGRDRDAEAVELIVSDNGPGFAEDVLNQLFEPYVTTKPKGTGVGLPIVKRIVEEHHGSICARNTPVGAQIEVRFPVPDHRQSKSQSHAKAGRETSL
ncbi:MAG: ATP-binding protein [Nitrococcus sp.]|nr:ATP-binding protein [Nitrococcus sp.]